MRRPCAQLRADCWRLPGEDSTTPREDREPTRSFVVYSGEDRHPVAEGVEAVGLREMAAVLMAE